MRKWAVWIVIIAAIVGGILSWIALHHYYGLLKGAFDHPSFCNISDQFNCDLVAASSYATLLGQPIAGFALLYFIAQFLFGVWALIGGAGGDRRSTAAIGALIGGAALVYPVYLIYIMATKLHTLCLTCLGMDATLLLIALGWLLAVKERGEGWMALWKRQWAGHAVLLTGVIGIGVIFLASGTHAAYDAAKQPRLSAAQIEQAVAAYKKGSLFDLQFNAAEHPVWGNPNASLTVVEFSDFQCPHCRIAAMELHNTLAEFRDQLRFVFINYPLDSTCNSDIEKPFHPYSCLAARAAVCAHTMGRFWPYQHDLFLHQEQLSRELMLKTAKVHGFDETQFTVCLDDPATEAALKADVALGHHVHVTGTPTVLVNNRQVNNWRSRDVLRAIIQSELKK